jgi:hypothetical protein
VIAVSTNYDFARPGQLLAVHLEVVRAVLYASGLVVRGTGSSNEIDRAPFLGAAKIGMYRSQI